MNRRQFLRWSASVSLTLAGCQYWPSEGFSNDCLAGGLPAALRDHELVRATWHGIDTQQVWDCHCHLIGVGDSGSGIWINPKMKSLWHPMQRAQFRFYLNAACVTQGSAPSVDQRVLQHLLALHTDLPTGFRWMLLAFDYYRDADGKIVREYSPFHVPNQYAQACVQRYPEHFEWIASIHPYRDDALSELEDVISNQARAIKWLPSAMGIDPSHPRCDAFYETLRKFNVPILTHSGAEYAVDVPEGQRYNNPLLFRRALDQGVRVIFAHCASVGKSIDLDQGPNGPMVDSLELFARLMDDPRYEKLAFGDLSAITQVNRDRDKIARIVETQEWHDRLLYGSDYPLPGVMPVFSPGNFVDWDMLPQTTATLLSQVRRYNPILFDVMLKRLITVKGKSFKPSVFETSRHFSSAV